MKIIWLGVLLMLTLHHMSTTNADVNAPRTIDVEFKAFFDGSIQRYVMVLPEAFAPKQPHDVLIALHGHGSDRWQYVKDDRDECRSARDVATERNMIFVSPDYRAKTSWMGPAAEADMVQIIGELKQKYQVARVFLCGASMGGASSLTLAALHPQLFAGVVSMNGTANHLEYENFQDAIRESFGGTKTEVPLEYKKRSAEYWPEKLTMPLGLNVSGQDTSVPPQSVLRLAAILKTLERPVMLLYRPETGHTTNYADARSTLEFVVEHAEAPKP